MQSNNVKELLLEHFPAVRNGEMVLVDFGECVDVQDHGEELFFSFSPHSVTIRPVYDGTYMPRGHERRWHIAIYHFTGEIGDVWRCVTSLRRVDAFKRAIYFQEKN